MCCGFQHEEEIVEERDSWGLLFFSSFFFLFSPKCFLAWILSKIWLTFSQIASAWVWFLNPNPPLRGLSTKPWQRAQLWGSGLVKPYQSSQAELSNCKMLLLLLLSHLAPCPCGCSQALCHILVAQCDAAGAVRYFHPAMQT